MACCIGVCNLYRSRKLQESRLRYAFGDKWCCYCGVFMKCVEGRCPCCRTRLRTRPAKKSVAERRDSYVLNQIATYGAARIINERIQTGL